MRMPENEADEAERDRFADVVGEWGDEDLVHLCPLCGEGELRQEALGPGKQAVWRCSRSSMCLYETGDYWGRPLQRYSCNACCRPLRLTRSNPANRQWVCEGYFDTQRTCETVHPDDDGRPAYHQGQRMGRPLHHPYRSEGVDHA